MVTAALAAEPARCEAVFTGPTRACSLSGQWTASGTGKVESQARKAAVRRLEDLIASAVESRQAQTSGTLAAATTARDAFACRQGLAQQARIYCYPEPELIERQLCFASFKDADCWRGLPVTIEAPAWRGMEMGREQLCDAVVDAVPATASDAHRLDCRVRCLQESSVRCIASE
jgi:hypothetical protein